jgi:serine/threonine protein kinase
MGAMRRSQNRDKKPTNFNPEKTKHRMIDPQGTETVPAYKAMGHIDALPAGTVLGEFEILGLLGVGGFGMVYRGYDRSLHRPVAIKEYMPAALVARKDDHGLSARSASDAQTFQAGLASFIAEARLLARFDHPSLVKVYRFWEANNTAYMAMPLYQGITLKQARMQMSGPPPEEWLRVILWSVLEALKVLHAGEALHRDVSPDNIFLQDIGPPVLLDLGAARMAVMEGSKKHTAVLKVNFAPIEQYADVSDLREGPWTDLYALAAVVHGCVCNEAPLPASIRVVRDRLPSMAKIAKTTQSHFGQSYSSAFVKAIDHALAVQPGWRPQTIEAFAKELKLRSVSQVQRFDWRAALGDKITLSTDPEATVVAFGASATVADTVPFAQAGSVAEKVEAVAKFVQPLTDQAQKRIPAWTLLVGALVLIGGAWAWNAAMTRSPSAEVSANSSVQKTEPSDQSAASPGTLPVQNPASVAPASDAAILVPLEAVSAPVSIPVAKVQPVPIVPGRTPPKKAADSSREEIKPVAEPAPVTKPEPQAPPKPAENTQHRPAPVLCPDSNVFTRPMCIYRECQKSEYRNLQVCIDDRKRWEDRDKAGKP